ncbi:MAG: GNAT family N-acetyltransferase [Rhodoglobus sp.]
MIRALTMDEVTSTEFRHLLWLSVEVADTELDDIIRDEVPNLTILGVVDFDRVVAFVALSLNSDPLTIEYIAVDESVRGRGYGTALVEAVRNHAKDRIVYAQTDDDAVGFYRRIGFAISAGEPDPRWPDRQRYDCVLA